MLTNCDAIIPPKESISRVGNLSGISCLIPPLLTVTRSIIACLRGSMSQEFSTVSENSVQGLLVNFSLANALDLEKGIWLIPIRVVALSIKEGSSSKSEMDSWKASMWSRSAWGRSASGITLIVMASLVARRKIISVANRVQRLSFLGKRTSVRASRTELLPADWSPQTTS